MKAQYTKSESVFLKPKPVEDESYEEIIDTTGGSGASSMSNSGTSDPSSSDTSEANSGSQDKTDTNGVLEN